MSSHHIPELYELFFKRRLMMNDESVETDNPQIYRANGNKHLIQDCDVISSRLRRVPGRSRNNSTILVLETSILYRLFTLTRTQKALNIFKSLRKFFRICFQKNDISDTLVLIMDLYALFILMMHNNLFTISNKFHLHYVKRRSCNGST